VSYTYATGKSVLTCRKHQRAIYPSSELDAAYQAKNLSFSPRIDNV